MHNEQRSVATLLILHIQLSGFLLGPFSFFSNMFSKHPCKHPQVEEEEGTKNPRRGDWPHHNKANHIGVCRGGKEGGGSGGAVPTRLPFQPSERRDPLASVSATWKCCLLWFATRRQEGKAYKEKAARHSVQIQTEKRSKDGLVKKTLDYELVPHNWQTKTCVVGARVE